MNMQCPSCGGLIAARNEAIQVFDKNLGTYGLSQARFEECTSCRARFFGPETAQSLSEARERVREALIRGRPLAEFVSSTEAARILGSTRQNLGKRRRVLYSTQIGKVHVYLRQSVVLLRETGDGRFSIAWQTSGTLGEGQPAYTGGERQLWDRTPAYSRLPEYEPAAVRYSVSANAQAGGTA